MMALPEWMTKKREDVLAIATKHGACHIRVFGSVARGNPQPDSDIDFLVDMQQGRSLVDLGEYSWNFVMWMSLRKRACGLASAVVFSRKLFPYEKRQ